MKPLIIWVVWAVLGVVIFTALLLGFIGRHFTLRTLRCVTAATVAALIVLVTAYGLRHATGSPDLANAFTQGADELSAAFFHPLLLVLPGQVSSPAPGRIGWIVIGVLLVIGYRVLEAWAMHRQAPSLDTTALGNSQPDDASGETTNSVTDKQRHDQLVAQLKFRLAAIDVRAPAILPGGTRSNDLASIAETSSVAGGNLAGAIIRFFGMLWPSPRRFQLRVRVESSRGDPHDGKPQGTNGMKVTISLDDPGSGKSIATKTMVANDLDEAAVVAAGYVARQIFSRDPTTPLWCVGASNGRDLAAMLLAKQERVYARSPDDIRSARDRQIEILEKAAGNIQCAGVVRYELAQLYDLAGRHIAALRLHAVNREQHPRFYRGRYRLSMSLDMVANPVFRLLGPADEEMLDEILAILSRCGVTQGVKRQDDDIVDSRLHLRLREKLLEAAGKELREIRQQVTLRHVIWGTFLHRDERVIRMSLWGLRKRQSFHDGLCVAELLVAVRQNLNEPRCFRASMIPHHMKLALRIATYIAGDNAPIKQQLTNQKVQDKPGHRGEPESTDHKWPPAEKRDRTRRLPWHRSTPSWEAAYNTACVYAALYFDSRVVISLQRAINNPDCEMQRPWDWISHDPDFSRLKWPKGEFTKFLDAQKERDYPAAIPPAEPDGTENGTGRGVSAGHPRRCPPANAVERGQFAGVAVPEDFLLLRGPPAHGI
jgi:hypothetical protein